MLLSLNKYIINNVPVKKKMIFYIASVFVFIMTNIGNVAAYNFS